MIIRYIFLFLAFGLVTACASDGVVMSEGSDSIFVIDESHTPYEWHRHHYGPDRGFYRHDGFRESSYANDSMLVR